MVFEYNDKQYNIIIKKKNNKNTYIRIKEGNIYITTNYFSSNHFIKKLLKDNYDTIIKMIDKHEVKQKRKNEFNLFGKKYNIIFSNCTKPYIKDDSIIVKDEKQLDKFVKKIIKPIFEEHLYKKYYLFEEKIPKPNLKLRKMSTRWGVCNTKTFNITLNTELHKFDIECLDYVIIHELSHLIEGNHSKNFWNIVKKYCPSYKEIKKKLNN